MITNNKSNLINNIFILKKLNGQHQKYKHIKDFQINQMSGHLDVVCMKCLVLVKYHLVYIWMI
jgi:hypothetical protein